MPSDSNSFKSKKEEWKLNAAEGVSGDIIRKLSLRKTESGSDSLQRQLSSRTWCEQKRDQFELVASEAVFQECQQGDLHAVRERRIILNEVALLPLTSEILELARQLIRPGVLPTSAAADAIHIAAATAYGCDYLLTWNFKHINNASIKRHTVRIIEDYGYEATTICTPDELMGPIS